MLKSCDLHEIKFQYAADHCTLCEAEGRVLTDVTPVQGFQYDSMDDGQPRNFTICKILKRATVSDTELREYGPAFLCEFGDGEQKVCYSCELQPWYAV